MPFGLSEETLDKLTGVVRKHSAVKNMVLYGSRATGRFKPYSDIDLTLIGDTLTRDDLIHIWLEIDDLNLPYEVDLSIFTEIDHPGLIKEIESHGVSLL